MFYKIGALKIFQNTQVQNTCAGTLKNGTLAQVFSCEFCGIFKNSFLVEDIRLTASV